MSIATGAKSALFMKEETTYAVLPTGNWDTVLFNSEGLGTSIGKIQSEEIKGDRTKGAIRGGNISAGGNISMNWYIKKLGLWFKHLLANTITSTTHAPIALAAGAITRGTFVTSGGNIYVALGDGTVPASPTLTVTSKQKQTLNNVDYQHVAATGTTLYQHVITGGATFPTGGLAFEKRVGGGNSDVYFSFLGGRVNSAAINVPQNGIASIAFDLLFQKPNGGASTTSVAGTPTLTSDEPSTGFDTLVKLAGTYSAVVESMTLNVSNNFDANVFVLGSRYRKDTPTGDRMITGTMSVLFETKTEYDLFINETEFALEISTICDGFTSLIELPECKFADGDPTPKIAGNGTVRVTFNFTAYKQDAAHDIRVTMRNSLASY